MGAMSETSTSKVLILEPAAKAGTRIEMLTLLAAVAATTLVLLLPRPEGLPAEGQRLAAAFIGILILWSTEALPIAITSLLAIALQPIFGLSSILAPGARVNTGTILGAAFTNFISAPFFFVLFMFTIAFAWVKTGLARRFALWMIAQAGTDARRAVYVFMFGAGLISAIISDVPCAAIFMAIALGIFDKLGLQPGKSQFAKAVMMGIPIASLIGGVGTPAGSSINILGLTMIEQNGGDRIPFLHWMAIGMPMVLILLPIAAWIMVKLLPPEIDTIGDLEDIQRERRRLGPLGREEKKVIAIMSTMVALWIASTWLPALDPVLIALLGAAAMFVPGINLFTWKEAQNATGWDTLLMMGGVSSLGLASRSTGLAQWLADSALGGLQDWSTVGVIVAISAFTVVIHLMLPVAPVINAVMIPPIMVLGQQAGINPVIYALPVIFTASCAFLLPLDAVPLVTYSKGYYKMFDMFLPGALISVIWVIVMTALLLMIGPRVGIL
jgi:sodium-dependent dicarboxylate transporter 2/3/5